jgi:hypothetical protein
LSLSAEKSVYYVYEPLKLTFTVTNQGNEVITGDFLFGLENGMVSILYKKPDGVIHEYNSLRIAQGKSFSVVNLDRIQLKLGQQLSHEEVIVFDTKTDDFVLSDPGEYELRATVQYVLNDPSKKIESNPLRITVLNPLKEEMSVLSAWANKKLALAVQGDAPYLKTPDEYLQAIQQLKGFVQSYPSRVYAQYGKERLIKYLQDLKKRGKLTKEDKAVGPGHADVQCEGVRDGVHALQ